MANNKELASMIVELLGGSSNISNALHCVCASTCGTSASQSWTKSGS